MAYLDLETEQAKFRVILGKHQIVTQSSQLPEECSAVVLEGGFSVSPGGLRSAYLMMEGSPGYSPQYREVTAEARRRGISIAMAESPRQLYGNERIQLLASAETGLAYLAAEQIAHSDGCLDGNHHLIQALRDEVAIDESANPNSHLHYQNVMMAQTAYSFANLQIEEGLSAYPTIIVGAFHIGVIDVLGMSPRERIKILNDQLDNEAYCKGTLRDILYIEYNPMLKKWKRKTLIQGVATRGESL